MEASGGMQGLGAWGLRKGEASRHLGVAAACVLHHTVYLRSHVEAFHNTKAYRPPVADRARGGGRRAVVAGTGRAVAVARVFAPG